MNEVDNMTQLGFYLNRVIPRLVSTFNGMLEARRIPINHPQFEVMQLLWGIDRDNISQQEIANTIGRDKAAISRALTQLEKQGYVVREAVSGNKNGISLTDKGRALQQASNEVLTGTISEFCSPLSPDERLQLLALLKKIYG